MFFTSEWAYYLELSLVEMGKMRDLLACQPRKWIDIALWGVVKAQMEVAAQYA